MGAVRLSLFQDRISGQIYQCGLQGNREYVIPSPNNTVQVFGRVGQSISPPLPPEALEAFKTNRNRTKK